MNKIIATTDFSDNSKAGLYFAIQLASQNNYELTFFHTYHTLIPSAWDVVQINNYENEQADIIDKKLKVFIENIYKELSIVDAKYYCVVKSSVFIDAAIREYAEQNSFSFICISTRGVGNLRRLLGTNTSNLINKSAVPVIAVPHHYVMEAITQVLYVSDLYHYENEMDKVMAFAKPLNTSIELLHLTYSHEQAADFEKIEELIKKIDYYNINFKLKPGNSYKSLVSDIEVAVKTIKPSIIIMFTEQNRNWFEKIFLSSKSAAYSFDAKVPLLVFYKT